MDLPCLFLALSIKLDPVHGQVLLHASGLYEENQMTRATAELGSCV